MLDSCNLKPYLFWLKFIFFKKATTFYEIFTLFLSYVVPVKSKVKISQNFVAFSEYMNFNPIKAGPFLGGDQLGGGTVWYPP